MDPKENISTDVQFHGRHLRPTLNFEVAKRNSGKKGSNVIRVYGVPIFEIDLKTKNVYLRIGFTEDIHKRIASGELILRPDMPSKIDDSTQNILLNAEKRKLKNLTRVWHS